MSVRDNLTRLGIALPAATTPVGAFVPSVRIGDLVFLSGHIAKRDGAPWLGRLGTDLTTLQGREAARAVAIDLLGSLQAAVGDLDRVLRIVKLMILVNSSRQFTEQHLVANGASELLVDVFGASEGAHARSAFGVSQIPFGACVEIDLIAQVR